MATQVVEMDYSTITAVSKGFGAQADALKVIAKILEVAIQILIATAFLSGGLNLIHARYLEVIKKKTKKLAEICNEFSGDLAKAINDHKKGDVRGKSYFGEGVS